MATAGSTRVDSGRPIEAEAPGGTVRPALLDVVGRSHAEVSRLLGLTFTESATEGDARRALRAADMTVAAISAHVYAVQRVVYPIARRRLPDGRVQVARLKGCAREMAYVTRGVFQHIQGDMHRPAESMGTLRARLAELAEQHEAIEDALIAELERVLGDQELGLLVSRYERSMRVAPTRPHPHVPDADLVAGLALRLAGSWDHILDAMDARTAPNTPVREPLPLGLWGSYLLGQPLPAASTVHGASVGGTIAPSGDTEGAGGVAPAGVAVPTGGDTASMAPGGSYPDGKAREGEA